MIETLFAFDPATLVTFIVAGLLLNITPGADFLFVTATGINGGARIGQAAAIGNSAGVLVHIALAAMGVSALLIAHPPLYHVIRYLGVAYLLFIAYHAWNDSGELGEGQAAPTAGIAMKRGLLTNILNPKTALFIFAFIPQFTDLSVGPIWHQIVILGLIFFFNGFIFNLILGTMAGFLGPVLRGHIRILNKLTAILFGGLAARLAIP